MINILFCGNKAVVDGIKLCLLSIIKHTSKPLNVFILTSNLSTINPCFVEISQTDISSVELEMMKINPNSKISIVNIDNIFKPWLETCKNNTTSFTPYSFLRLFAEKIPNVPNKLLYLDADILFNGNIEELFNQNIENYHIAVVLDKNGHILIKPKYFNSGMMLLNMKQIKEDNLFSIARHICATKKMAFPDQSALNKTKFKKLYLPRKFNEQGKLKPNTIVHHFSKKIKWLPFFHTINIKPWEIDNVHKIYKYYIYDDIYEQFKNLK